MLDSPILIGVPSIKAVSRVERYVTMKPYLAQIFLHVTATLKYRYLGVVTQELLHGLSALGAYECGA